MSVSSHLGSGSASSGYLEDLMLSFREDAPNVRFNVTAVEQCGLNGSGPLYSVVGLTDTGYWYSVGLAWNWPSSFGPLTVSDGPWALYAVYGASGLVFEVANRLSNVGDQDVVLLELSFSRDLVNMHVKDWNSSTADEETYSAFGAASFVGNLNSPSSNGFFSGMATRQYYNGPHFGGHRMVTYKGSSARISSWMRIVEYDYPGKSANLFDSYGSYSYDDPYIFQNLTSNGAFVASNAYGFVTGNLAEGLKCKAPGLLDQLSPYWFIVPLAVIGALASGLIRWIWGRSGRWQMPSPQPTGPLVASFRRVSSFPITVTPMGHS